MRTRGNRSGRVTSYMTVKVTVHTMANHSAD